MRAFITFIILGPLLFLAVLAGCAVLLVFAVGFLGWDAEIITNAFHSFYDNFTWAKLRFAWVVGLILTFVFMAMDL